MGKIRRLSYWSHTIASPTGKQRAMSLKTLRGHCSKSFSVDDKVIMPHQTHCHDHFTIFTQNIFWRITSKTDIKVNHNFFILLQNRASLSLLYLKEIQQSNVQKICKSCFVWCNLMWYNLATFYGRHYTLQTVPRRLPSWTGGRAAHYLLFTFL